MGARAEAAQRTRESILDGGVRAFADRWYDEVTLADVAREAGVSQQTVVNHFGSKENLYLCGLNERFAPRVAAARSGVVIGDIASVVQTLVDDYEVTGTSTICVLALAERHPPLAEVTRTDADTTGAGSPRSWRPIGRRIGGRPRPHCESVDHGVGRPDLVPTGHEEGRSVTETQQDLCRLVEALLER